MSKKGGGGRGWHVTGTAKSTGGRCVACHRTVFYGERCQDCQRELRQRRKRKSR
jgi:hypothetical protein